MEIIKYIDLYVGAVINIFLYAIVIKKVFNIRFTKNKKFILLYILLTSFFVFIINLFNKNVFKILLTIPFVTIGMKSIFYVNYKNSIIYVVIATIYMFISEIIVGFILSLLPFDYTFVFNNILGTTTGAIVVAIFTILILYVKKISKNVNKFVDNINYNNQLIYSIIIVMIIGAFSYKNSTNIENIISLLSNFAILIAFAIVLYMSYLEIVKSKEVSENYNNLFNYLEKYECELIEKRKIIHDYKNQLIVINGYIGNDQKLREYIKELIKEQRSIKENSVIKNIDKLPKGIKGLVYYKFSYIDNNIIVDMQVKNKLSKFDNLEPRINKDVLKIIGILIDNAIEALNDEETKYINIEFSLQKGIFKMKIINPCTNKIKIDNLMNSGFSTKGKNRGYGLALVKDITRKEKSINVDIKKEEDEFVATLEVKI